MKEEIKVEPRITNWDEFEERCRLAREQNISLLDENNSLNEEIF